MKWIAATVVSIAALTCAAGSAGAAGLEQAVARSRQTGLPLLVLGTSDT
jgi:hypothetical protein